jgi:hypothetical protein
MAKNALRRGTIIAVTWPGESDGRIDDRDRRVIRNEALFREVNERIEEVSAEASGSKFTNFVCECGEDACLELIELTLQEYEEVRSVSDHFAMKPGHEHPDFERIVHRGDRYVVVEKVGVADDTAHRTDPRI